MPGKEEREQIRSREEAEQRRHREEEERKRHEQFARAAAETAVRAAREEEKRKSAVRNADPSPDAAATAAASSLPTNYLVRCPACNTQVSQSAESCPKCGHKFTEAAMHEMMVLAQTERTVQAREACVVAFFLVFLVIVVVGISVANLPSRRPPATDYEKMIEDHPAPNYSLEDDLGSVGESSASSLRRDTTAAINQDVYSRMTDLVVAGDRSGVENLILAGQVFYLPEGTRVRIIDPGIFTTEIKVESGPYAGRYFIVASDHINH